ncbi:hypothetical protein BGZ82_003403 [Podila clonocystis]|nr:hypothetical protein BGZ82_003403 [Podila clonocystis]
MNDNNLTLFRLTDGDPTSIAFPVSIPSTDTVGTLKKLFKTEKSPEFDDVAADKLTLWRISIPIIDNNESPILLDILTDKKKLLPRTYISACLPTDCLTTPNTSLCRNHSQF